MNRFVGFLGIVVLLAAACAPQRVNVEEERNALMERDRAWAETPADPDRFLDFVAPDGSLYPPGMPVAEGHDAIGAFMAELGSTPGFSVTWRPSSAVVAGSGDLGYTVGTYDMTVASDTGAPLSEKGKYVTVWRKEPDGPWMVVADIFNADTPPPSDTGMDEEE